MFILRALLQTGCLQLPVDTLLMPLLIEIHCWISNSRRLRRGLEDEMELHLVTHCLWFERLTKGERISD